MPIKNRFAEILPEITAWRHDFHQHPELMFDVERTAGRVAALLREFGCDEVIEGIGRTGVVGVIHGQAGGGQAGSGDRAIGLRADMDALPVREQADVPYASKEAGKMHACGHDGHTAMLLGAAKYLCETRAFKGRAVVIFQPAEEGGGGGLEMCRDGLMERFGIEEVYAIHNMPGIPVGEFAICDGPIMAACDQFDIRVVGRGGHAATPHDAVDAVVVAAQIIMALQTIASRNVNPHDQVVVSTCAIKSDSSVHNVIAQEVMLRGTVRTMRPELRDYVEERVNQIVTATAEAFGARAEIAYDRGYPVTSNRPEYAALAVEGAKRVTDKVNPNVTPMMGAEDFSYMLEARPGAYIWLGNGDSAILHSADYIFDDRALPYGASWFVEMVEARLPA
ncbi:amidohydrolase [Thioclava kandeliae]|uniref:Amidohydrolase n=1 Tax=Thioclava kandeliae TaxID=3070818 RepID=A0ABV1SBV9_9RHOB